MSSEDEPRDRELENVLGQFLVASFQGDKLAEMIHEKVSYRGARDFRFIIPGKVGERQPLAVTVKIEPFVAKPLKSSKERKVGMGGVRAICLLESPDLDLPPEQLSNGVHEAITGSLEWWTHQEAMSDLNLQDWKVNVCVIDSKDSKKLTSAYALLGNLEARRKGEIIER